MIARSVPLIVCLAWLAFESHFSPSFFVATLERSIASITGGMNEVVAAEYPAQFQTALASADAAQ